MWKPIVENPNGILHRNIPFIVCQYNKIVIWIIFCHDGFQGYPPNAKSKLKIYVEHILNNNYTLIRMFKGGNVFKNVASGLRKRVHLVLYFIVYAKVNVRFECVKKSLPIRSLIRKLSSMNIDKWRIYASVMDVTIDAMWTCRLFGAKPLSEPMLTNTP